MRLSTIRRPGVAAPIVALGLLIGVSLAPVTAATPYIRDVYFTAGYERQIDKRTCVPASTAMMLNFIARRDLRLDQMDILRYAQPRDALDDDVQRGTDPLGWAKALTRYARETDRSFEYRWEAHTTEMAALKRAAYLIALTNMPVGLTILNGRHAVVMTGFEANRDPREGDFKLIGVRISDPLRQSRVRYGASDVPTNKYLERDATSYYDRAWYGKYVIVVPDARMGLARAT